MLLAAMNLVVCGQGEVGGETLSVVDDDWNAAACSMYLKRRLRALELGK